jgi:ABC-type transport system involved in multi-copper enzyme maturation permease subunit
MSILALLWKDVRVNRWVLAFGAVVLTVPYLVYLTCGLCGDWSDWWHFEPLSLFNNISGILSMITIALLGGHAFAAERSDRSAEFLAYLPPSRLAIATSKAVFTFGAILVLLLCHLIVGLFILWLIPGAPPVSDSVNFHYVVILLFGVAWLCSTFASSPALAAAGAVLVSIGSSIGMHFWLNASLPLETITQYYNIFCVVGGVACFIAGTVYYIRRFAP